MRKILIAVSVMVVLAATNAQAYSTVLEGWTFGDEVQATIDVSFDGTNVLVDVKNTSPSANTSWITGLLFALPEGVVLPAVKETQHDWIFAPLSSIQVPTNSDAINQYIADINAGIVTKKNLVFKGGSTSIGIGVGSSLTFEFAVSDPSAFALDDGMFNPFLARFQGILIDGEKPDWADDSDVGTPTPIPGAAWLFGTGLLGLVGLRRKVRA